MSSLNWIVFGIFCTIFNITVGQDVPRPPFVRLNVTLYEKIFAGIAPQTLSEGHFAVFWGINGTVSFRAYKPDETRLYDSSTPTFTENVQWLENTISLRITKGGFDYIAVTTSPPMILKYDGSTFTTKILQLNSYEGSMSLFAQDDYFMLGTCNTTLSNAYYIRYITLDGRVERTQNLHPEEACTVKLYKEFVYTPVLKSERQAYYITYFNGSTYRKELDYRAVSYSIYFIGDFRVLFEEGGGNWFLSLQSTRTLRDINVGAFSAATCREFETSSNTTHLTVMCINENNVAAITVVDVANFTGEVSIHKYKNILFKEHISPHSQPFMPNNEEIGMVAYSTQTGGFHANIFTTVDISLLSLQFLRNITTLENIPASLHQGQKDEYLWRRDLLHAKQFKWSNHTDEVHLTKVNLSGYNITGQLPMNLFGLRYLEYLDLSHNKLSGTASDLIYSIGLSVINMSNNALTGCPPVWSPETSCNFSRNMLGFGMHCENSLCDWSHQYYSIRGLEPATPALWYWTQFKPSNIRSTSSSYLWNDLVVFAGDEKNKVVEFFNTTSGTWGILGNLYLARSYPSVAAVGPYLVISGGMSQIQPTGTVDIYNSLNNTWSVTHTEQPRGLHPAITIGDEIWLGGSSAIEILNPATRKWRVLENRQINGSVATTPYAIVTGFGMIYDRVNDKWSSFKGHPEAVVVAFEDTKVAVLSPSSNTLDILDTYGWIWSHKPKNASKALCGAHSEGHLVFLSSDFRKNYLELKLFNLTSEQWTGEPFPYREFTGQATAFPNHKRQILFASTSLAVFTWKGFAPSFWPPIAPPATVSAESPLSPPTAEEPVHSPQTPTITEGPVHSSPQQTSPTMSPTSVVGQPHGESPASGEDNSSAFVWIIVAIITVVVVVGLAFLWLRKRNLKSSSSKEEEEGLMDELTEQDSINNSQREFNPADILFSEISVGEKLGEGSFGEIYKAKWHGQTVVIKKMKPSMLNKTMMIEEALTLTSLHHKHIVLSMGISKNEETDSVILVMEYMKNGSLEDLIFRDKIPLTRQDIIRLALDVAKGLNYLHSLNPKIIHRDLKGANVLLYQNRKRAKISDFGTARFLNSGSSAAKTVIGTFGSIAPEILQEAPYNEKADIYSFGVLLFEMTTRCVLAVIFEEEKRIEKISNTVEDPQFKQLIINCCRTDPIERPSIRRCIEVLKQLKAK